MKAPSGNVTFKPSTSPECFRAVATGVGHTIGISKATGEARKALVRQRPGTIGLAPKNEGFAAESQTYHKDWYGTAGDADAAMQPGSIPPNSSR